MSPLPGRRFGEHGILTYCNDNPLMGRQDLPAKAARASSAHVQSRFPTSAEPHQSALQAGAGWLPSTGSLSSVDTMSLICSPASATSIFPPTAAAMPRMAPAE